MVSNRGTNLVIKIMSRSMFTILDDQSLNSTMTLISTPTFERHGALHIPGRVKSRETRSEIRGNTNRSCFLNQGLR